MKACPYCHQLPSTRWDSGIRCLYPTESVDTFSGHVIELRQSIAQPERHGGATVAPAEAGATIIFAVRNDGGLNVIYCDGKSDRAVLSPSDTDRLRALLGSGGGK